MVGHPSGQQIDLAGRQRVVHLLGRLTDVIFLGAPHFGIQDAIPRQSANHLRQLVRPGLVLRYPEALR